MVKLQIEKLKCNIRDAASFSILALIDWQLTWKYNENWIFAF